MDSRNIFSWEPVWEAVSAITAAAHEDEIQGAILLYPAFILVDDAKEQFDSTADIPTLTISCG
ncbi:MAG: hypothetical protein ACLSB9_32110 [Hydrogeniiclostridium mannosilyticum]